jgi:hypothetical protein
MDDTGNGNSVNVRDGNEKVKIVSYTEWLSIVTPVKKQVGGKGDVYLSRHTLEFHSRMSAKKKRGAAYAGTPHRLS